MDDRTEVTLHSPAKLGHRILQAGTHSVTADELALLKEAGVLVLADPAPVMLATTSIDFTDPAVEAAIEAEVQKRVGKAFDGALGKLEAEAKDLLKAFDAQEVEKNDAVNRAVLAEAKHAELQGVITGLEVALVAATAPPAINTDITGAPAKKAKG